MTGEPAEGWISRVGAAGLTVELGWVDDANLGPPPVSITRGPGALTGGGD
ncbi:MAG TPA: hypothetical protein VHQ03_03480 [Candidatus Dormibacteraeota bacterium]|nr:hypothetical protein [Candidatus Dormibacteraeota bacterium]